MASRKTVCAICAVSFQIGRIRHSDEPRSATISSGRYNEPTGELDEEGISFAPETIDFECPAEAGCGIVMRRLVDEGGILGQDGDGVLRYDFPTYEGVGPAKMLKQAYRRAKETALRWIQFDVHRDEVGRRSDGYVDHSQDEDGEYQPSMSSGSEDPLEYDSEVIDSDPEPEDDLEEEANEETSRITDFLTRTFQMANYPEHQDFADDYGDLYHDSDSFHGLLPWHCRPESRKQPEDFVFSRDSLAGMGFGSQEDIIDWATDFEHVAGPECQRRDGYNGNIISMDEMRGCRTYQYLFHKPSAARDLGGHWKSQEVDAEPFEIESDWALSGVAESNSMLGLGYTDSDVFPERHGVRHRPYPHFESHDLDYAPCFHPWCWEIFCRVLKRQHGDLRVDGFVSWFETASSNRAAEFRAIRMSGTARNSTLTLS